MPEAYADLAVSFVRYEARASGLKPLGQILGTMSLQSETIERGTTVKTNAGKWKMKIWASAISGALFVLAGCSQLTVAQNSFPSSGNVAIGTTSPGQALSVGGNIEMKGGANVTRYIVTDESSSGNTHVVMQAGFGSTGAGAAGS